MKSTTEIKLFDFELHNNNDHCANVKNLLLYIKYKQEGLKINVYTDGEVGSHQTLFEQMVGRLQIGVKASSNEFGVCLLRVLKCMVDCHHDLNIFWWMPNEKFHFYEGENWKGYTWDRIINLLDKQFRGYVSEFNLIEETSEIKNPTKNIALWDVDDLLKFVENCPK